MTNVAPALQGSLCYISYHISIHFTHPEKRSTVGRPLLFYLILLGSTGFYFILLGSTGFYWVLLQPQLLCSPTASQMTLALSTPG